MFFRVRAVMLDTGLQPYTDVADLFIIDPDGYIIRSVWNFEIFMHAVQYSARIIFIFQIFFLQKVDIFFRRVNTIFHSTQLSGNGIPSSSMLAFLARRFGFQSSLR